jgi:ferredoxin-NADP reductase
VTPALPADLYGRPRPDRFLRGLTAFSDAYQRMMDAAARPAGPRRTAVISAWLDLVVTARDAVCDEVVRLKLAAADGGTLPLWRPGAHVRIRLPSGKERHYSLCGDTSSERAYTIAVRRLETGSGSAEIHERLMPGTPVRVMRPRNGFPFAADPVVLFIAGGIGITPILPMARAAAALRLDWRLIYAGRSVATMPFAAEAIALDPARVEIRTDRTRDCAGMIGRAPTGAAVYACGPPPMLDGLRAAADAAGIRAFRFERFTAPPIVDGREFEMELRRKGIVVRVPMDRSALDVLLDHDPGAAFSCRQGFCGLCVQRVLAGRVEHRSPRLTGEGEMLVCVSRAAEGERLVLDR